MSAPTQDFCICRGIAKENGELVVGYYCRYGYTKQEKTYIIPVTASALYAIEVIPESVKRSTELTDQNGFVIYEGDFVMFGKNIYQVVFECGSFALYDKEGRMISKIGGLNDHCYSLMNLYLECCWEDGCAYDLKILNACE